MDPGFDPTDLRLVNSVFLFDMVTNFNWFFFYWKNIAWPIFFLTSIFFWSMNAKPYLCTAWLRLCKISSGVVTSILASISWFQISFFSKLKTLRYTDQDLPLEQICSTLLKGGGKPWNSTFITVALLHMQMIHSKNTFFMSGSHFILFTKKFIQRFVYVIEFVLIFYFYCLFFTIDYLLDASSGEEKK